MILYRVIRAEVGRPRMTRHFSFDNRHGAEAMWDAWIRLGPVRDGRQRVTMFADTI
ncbi:MAG: hypothetical protein ACRDT6_20815 [Micromonosporaceae bacterium]